MKKASFMRSPALLSPTSKWLNPLTLFCLIFSTTWGSINRLWVEFIFTSEIKERKPITSPIAVIDLKENENTKTIAEKMIVTITI